MSVERDIRFDLIARLCPNTTGAELRSVATEVNQKEKSRQYRLLMRLHVNRPACLPFVLVEKLLRNVTSLMLWRRSYAKGQSSRARKSEYFTSHAHLQLFLQALIPSLQLRGWKRSLTSLLGSICSVRGPSCTCTAMHCLLLMPIV